MESPKACVSPCTSRASQLTGVSIYTFAVILTLPQPKTSQPADVLAKSSTWRREHSRCSTRLMWVSCSHVKNVNSNANVADRGTKILSGIETRHTVSRLSLEFNQARDSSSTEPEKRVKLASPCRAMVRMEVRTIEIHILCAACVEPSWEVPNPSAMTRKK